MAARPIPYRGDQPFVFVSYAHRDSATVDAQLQHFDEQGFRVFYDEGIAPGQSWHLELETAIERCALLVFFASSNSVESKHCIREVHYAEQVDRPVLVVYVDEVELPGGLRLSLSDSQTVRAFELEPREALVRISSAVKALLPDPDLSAQGGTDLNLPSSHPQARRYNSRIALVTGLMLVAILVFQWSQS